VFISDSSSRKLTLKPGVPLEAGGVAACPRRPAPGAGAGGTAPLAAAAAGIPLPTAGLRCPSAPALLLGRARCSGSATRQLTVLRSSGHFLVVIF